MGRRNKQLEDIITESQGGVPEKEKKKKKKKKKATGEDRGEGEEEGEEEERGDEEKKEEGEEGQSPKPKVIKKYKMNENPNWAFVIDEDTGDEKEENVKVLVASAPTQELPPSPKPAHRRTHSRNNSADAYNSDGGERKSKQGSGLKDDTTQSPPQSPKPTHRRTHSRNNSADAYSSDGGSGISRRRAGSSALKNELKEEETTQGEKPQDAAHAEPAQEDATPVAMPEDAPPTQEAATPASTQEDAPPEATPQEDASHEEKAQRPTRPKKAPDAAASPGSPTRRRGKKGRLLRELSGFLKSSDGGTGFTIDDSQDESSEPEGASPSQRRRARTKRTTDAAAESQ